MKVKVISLPYISQVLYVLYLSMPRYQVSVYRTIGLLVIQVRAFEIVRSLKSLVMEQSVIHNSLHTNSVSLVSLLKTSEPSVGLKATHSGYPIRSPESRVFSFLPAAVIT